MHARECTCVRARAYTRIDFKQQVVSDESTVKLSPVASRTRSKESSQLVLKFPDSLTGVTKHHEDFVRCEEADVADTVKGLMQQQWTSLVMPGQKVKVKIKDKLVSAVIENCHFISKLSFDSLYFYATAKVDLRLSESDQLYRECQVRELIL